MIETTKWSQWVVQIRTQQIRDETAAIFKKRLITIPRNHSTDFDEICVNGDGSKTAKKSLKGVITEHHVDTEAM